MAARNTRNQTRARPQNVDSGGKGTEIWLRAPTSVAYAPCQANQKYTNYALRAGQMSPLYTHAYVHARQECSPAATAPLPGAGLLTPHRAVEATSSSRDFRGVRPRARCTATTTCSHTFRLCSFRCSFTACSSYSCCDFAITFDGARATSRSPVARPPLPPPSLPPPTLLLHVTLVLLSPPPSASPSLSAPALAKSRSIRRASWVSARRRDRSFMLGVNVHVACKLKPTVGRGVAG